MKVHFKVCARLVGRGDDAHVLGPLNGRFSRINQRHRPTNESDRHCRATRFEGHIRGSRPCCSRRQIFKDVGHGAGGTEKK